MTDIRIIKTKQAIKNAMIELLQEKSFDLITTTELVKRAGVSRSNFYTHYQDKYQLVDEYQSAFFKKISTIFQTHRTDLATAIYEIFSLLETDYSLESAFLSENGTREIHLYLIQQTKKFLETVIIPHYGKKSLSTVNIDYRTTYLSHAIFGMLQLWIKRGKQESPQEITKMYMLFISDSTAI
ncbi:TetR/AcrR family transcriptional regulator [Pseudolactococcus plantarum]|uniref:TetR family transcriptional regulator n=1 Tax=Pseudolactococcus plantarum TaxID=1365 RepID=A0A2A5S1X1_9LACT|nr:TetR/AcrR family transcriptional regulator [Lactococcus plantarum]PCS07450.1 TetR family transcriptional regulator [Lactococcus plantarum]